MKTDIKKIFCVVLLMLLLIMTNAAAISTTTSSKTDEKNNVLPTFQNQQVSLSSEENDLDPLVDLKVTVTIKEIRAFDKIDLFSNPDFYVKVFINEKESKSKIWKNQKYVNEPWSVTQDVPDNIELVSIKIQLWDSNYVLNKLCDIAKNDNQNTQRRDITVYYSLKTGHWYGDDSITIPSSWSLDYSGYGRANGCDDNSIYEKRDRDCELFFDITQNDYDNDTIPYWTEVNIYNKTGQCDPLIDDRGRDDDNDGVPIEWEHKWGHYFDWRYDHTTQNYTIEHRWQYHPFEYNDFKNLDPDEDSINNYEEYLTSQWGSDPFRKDIFVELDQMAAGPNREPASLLPEGSKDLMRDAFDRQNIVFHLDDGRWGNESGSDMIPFDNKGPNTTRGELMEMYNTYFLHGDENNWRHGVFHYGLVVYNSTYEGFVFNSNNAYQISAKKMDVKAQKIALGIPEVVYASCYMHELGHTLGLTWLLGHDNMGDSPYKILWWKTRAYKSIMNYGYMYGFIWNLVDYSDGSRGKNDFDDWSNINFSYFEN